MKEFKVLTIIQLVIFLSVTIFLLVREFDGHGAYQTLDAKLISISIWMIFYASIVIIECVVYVLLKISKKKKAKVNQ